MTGRLVLDSVAIGYDGQPLAEGINLALSGGSITCLMGPNGVGKTTLFKTVLGILRPLRGRILIDGHDIAALRPDRIARHVAHVPQAYQGDPSHTVIDIVVMGRTARLGLFATPGRDDYAAARRMLEALGIADLADRSADRVSGGQRQLMLIARALAQETDVIIMDEPTASLDLGNRFGLLAQIRALAARGLSLLVSTHEPEHAFAIADQVVLLGRGQPVEIGAVDAILTADRLRRLYGIELAIETTPLGRRVVSTAPADLTSRRPD